MTTQKLMEIFITDYKERVSNCLDFAPLNESFKKALLNSSITRNKGNELFSQFIKTLNAKTLENLENNDYSDLDVFFQKSGIFDDKPISKF